MEYRSWMNMTLDQFKQKEKELLENNQEMLKASTLLNIEID